MARMGGWGTHVLVYSDGAGYGTTNFRSGLWRNGMLRTQMFNGKPAYWVGACNLRVFIRCYGNISP